MNVILKTKQTQIIAECGLSHGGSLSAAKKFIKLVKKNFLGRLRRFVGETSSLA